MTHFAPVAPLNSLYKLAEAGALGTYQLLIAPIVLRQDWAYANFFRDEHIDQFVIVDNGVIELGVSIPAKDLAEAARIVGAQVVVLPDTIDDARMTVKLVERAMVDFRERDSATDTLGVVQGRTLEECMACAEGLVKAGVDWLGVPRGLTVHLGSRIRLVLRLATEFQLPMHLFGWSDNVGDDILAATAHRLVRGLDSATPVWAPSALPRVPSRTTTQRMGRRPLDFWTVPLGPHAVQNVQTVRQWLQDAQTVLSQREGLAAQTVPPTQP